MRKEAGYEEACAVLARLLEQADRMIGYSPKPEDGERYMRMAANTLVSCAHLSLGSVLIAIRDGMNSGGVDDRVYKLNTQIVNKWVADVERRIAAMARDEHEVKKAYWGTHGNMDERYLSRLEDQHLRKDKTISEMSRQIQDLRHKLKNPDQ